MTCARCARRAEAERTGRLRCMRAGRTSAMAQVAGTCGEMGGRKVSRERGTRGNESRAKVLSLQTWQSSRKSQNPPTISRSTWPRHGKTTFVCVHLYTCIAYACTSACETAARYTQASPRASGGPASSALVVAYSSVLGADEDFNARARACVLIG